MNKTLTNLDLSGNRISYAGATCISEAIVTGKSTDFSVCVIRNIFIRKLSHLTISSPFILIYQKMHKNHSSF